VTSVARRTSTLRRGRVDRECLDEVIVFESRSFAQLDDVVDFGGRDDADVRFLVDEREGSAPAKGHAFLGELTDRFPKARRERGSRRVRKIGRADLQGKLSAPARRGQSESRRANRLDALASATRG
jgi:hypothetical protein